MFGERPTGRLPTVAHRLLSALLHGCCITSSLAVGAPIFASHFSRKTAGFISGAEGSRTPALRRTKADRSIPSRPSVSGDFDVLQVFCRITGGSFSAAYWCVSARLQNHGRLVSPFHYHAQQTELRYQQGVLLPCWAPHWGTPGRRIRWCRGPRQWSASRTTLYSSVLGDGLVVSKKRSVGCSTLVEHRVFV
jgi:hypothetical protein